MKKINIKLFGEASFVEEFVIEFRFSDKKKEAVIITNGAGLYDETRTYLSKAIINIKDWENAKVNIFHHGTLISKDTVATQYRQLDKIIEFHNTDKKLKLIGYGLNGGWVEWTFTNPKVTIYGEIDESYSSDDG